MIEILQETNDWVAINKPAGLLVHRTKLAAGEKEHFALQLLRDQLGQHIFPVHRLDRPTSGVLLFSKNKEILSLLKAQFSERSVKKTYLALVRGIPSIEKGSFERELENERSGKLQAAKTDYELVHSVEIPFDTTGRYPTSRYSLLSLHPLTGRTHQIRIHLAQARHYIIGDKKHGNNKQNKFFEKQFNLQNLLLHAYRLEFKDPKTQQLIQIKAEIPVHFRTVLRNLHFPEKEV
ncbi:MAG: pseudouridylate synthase [Algoriphagus sp.]|uniref:pseudouridine synthase n=1 Tax=Algoriphagus sp. TaxID=1872435 RepID=UPI00181C0F25|nr:pseudouridine synthase [Algoriphagus sp.]NVJ85516.1 pseudouridylate synthase [Algoriphagus sp.]